MEASDTTSLEIEDLLTAMKREARKARMLRKLRNGVLVVWLVVLSLYFLLAYLLEWQKNPMIINAFIQPVNIIITMISNRINTDKRKSMVKQIICLKDKKACGAMADVLGFEDVELQKLAREALKILLPRLQATDTDLLSTTQRQHLHGVFKQQDAELTLILLHALEQVGDLRDWNAVQNLANRKTEGKIRDKAKVNPEVVLAAQACLPFLRANAERQEVRHTLLRAADSRSNTPEILLRPAQNTASEPQQLLRASLSAGNHNHSAE